MLKEVVSSILSLQGAVVEHSENEGIAVLSPPELQKSLLIPEFCKMGFGQEAPAGGTLITLESDWIERFEKLLGDQGKLFSCEYTPEDLVKWPSDIDKITKHIVFNNAVFRMQESEITDTACYLLTYRITALSDEKREDIVHLCFNDSNNIINDELSGQLLLYLKNTKKNNLMQDIKSNDSWIDAKIYNFAAAVLPVKLREKIRPFLSGMERRMDKDIERLHSYYSRLQNEAVDKIADKIQKEGDRESIERGKMRIESIKREYLAKTADLQRKYSMNVEADLVQALKIKMKVNRFHFKAMRRKGIRNFHLDWNPLTRKLEKITCEVCFSSPDVVFLCDDKLHFLCGSCLAPCRSCGKVSCRACSPRNCGRCGKIL